MHTMISKGDCRRDGDGADVVIVSGFGNFHMLGAAAEADRRGRLLKLFCGAYPTRRMSALLPGLRFLSGGLGRKLEGRSVGLSSDDLVKPLVLAESLSRIHVRASALGWSRVSDAFMAASLRLATHAVCRELPLPGRRGGIFHYRAGYGLDCADEARRLGFILLCDHSIAHPQALDALVAGDGVFGRPEPPEKLSLLWSLVLKDIRKADHVLLNSDFVKATFEACGEPTDTVSVIYQGIDSTFMQGVEAREKTLDAGDAIFCFAGYFTRRKGAHLILEALKHLPSRGWRLKLAGDIDPELAADLEAAVRAFPIEHVGNLNRQDLAGLMCDSDVFVFPSLAEGSARVVFEAMACGLYVIVTPNAGSVAEDGVNGRVVAPGDALALACAMTGAIGNAAVREIGARNADLIATRYAQTQYGERLENLYRRLLDGHSFQTHATQNEPAR